MSTECEYIRICIKLYPDGRIKVYPLFEDLEEQQLFIGQAERLTEVLTENQERLALAPEAEAKAVGGGN